MKPWILVAAIIALVITAASYYYVSTQDVFSQNISAQTESQPNQQVLAKLSEFSQVKPFASNPTNVTLLTTDELSKLSASQPTIYGDVPVGAYQVDYIGNPGLLVIYDFQNNKILKIYEIQNLNI